MSYYDLYIFFHWAHRYLGIYRSHKLEISVTLSLLSSFLSFSFSLSLIPFPFSRLFLFLDCSLCPIFFFFFLNLSFYRTKMVCFLFLSFALSVSLTFYTWIFRLLISGRKIKDSLTINVSLFSHSFMITLSEMLNSQFIKIGCY